MSDDDVMNPGGGHMSYPGGAGGYPGAAGSYNYGSQYITPGSNYHHGTVPPSQMSPYGPGGLGVMGGQTSPYSGDQFSNKTPPFQQSFQRPFSPTSAFPYGAAPAGIRHPQVGPGGHLHLGGGQDSMAVDLKTSSSMYPSAGQTYQRSSPYGYNGFGHSPHHQTSSYNSPDPTKPVEPFADNLSTRRHYENFYDKSSGDSPNPLENKPSISDSNDVDKADRRSNDDNGDDDATSRNGDDDADVKKEASVIDNLDALPFIPDIGDLKSDDASQRDGSDRHPGSDPSSPMRSRGLKRSHSPSIDAQDSESQDSYGPPPPQGMMPAGGHPDPEFNPGINEGGESLASSSNTLSRGDQK